MASSSLVLPLSGAKLLPEVHDRIPILFPSNRAVLVRPRDVSEGRGRSGLKLIKAHLRSRSPRNQYRAAKGLALDPQAVSPPRDDVDPETALKLRRLLPTSRPASADVPAKACASGPVNFPDSLERLLVGFINSCQMDALATPSPFLQPRPAQRVLRRWPGSGEHPASVAFGLARRAVTPCG